MAPRDHVAVPHDARCGLPRHACATSASRFFALWHGQLLPLLWIHRGEGVRILIESTRRRRDHRADRGALGHDRFVARRRAVRRALLGLVRELEADIDLAITPDGPRGPARSFAPGALVVAQRVGAPILPIAVSASRAWHLRSWDRFMIPKPFSRVNVTYSEPTPVTAPRPVRRKPTLPRFEALDPDGLIAMAERG